MAGVAGVAGKGAADRDLNSCAALVEIQMWQRILEMYTHAPLSPGTGAHTHTHLQVHTLD